MDSETCAAVSCSGDVHRREERGMDTPPMSPAEFFPSELLDLLGTARQVIDRHLNDHGTCTDCGLIWPCQRARLAESALAAI